MTIKTILTNKNSKLPTKAHDTDACFDLYACIENNIVIFPKSSDRKPLSEAQQER